PAGGATQTASAPRTRPRGSGTLAVAGHARRATPADSSRTSGTARGAAAAAPDARRTTAAAKRTSIRRPAPTNIAPRERQIDVALATPGGAHVESWPWRS